MLINIQDKNLLSTDHFDNYGHEKDKVSNSIHLGWKFLDVSGWNCYFHCPTLFATFFTVAA